MTGESQQLPKSEPDPTVITTEIISKEINHLKEKIELLMDERDRRYGERFDAQQLAVQNALNAAETAVHAAFESSEKAIIKAEVSIEKRADATYVSLQELSRSLAMLMPRSEAEGRLAALSEKVDAADRKVERLETAKSAVTEQKSDMRLNANMLVGMSGLVLTALIIFMAYASR